MWLLIVLTIVGGVGVKTTVSTHVDQKKCLEALKLVDPEDYPGYFLTTCSPQIEDED